MSIPDFRVLTGPVLEVLAAGKTHGHADLVDALGAQFKLTDEELNTMLPTGRQRLFHNRVAWSVVHLRKAGALRNEARGSFVITDRGRELLHQTNGKLGMKQLSAFDEYRVFRARSNADEGEDSKGRKSSELPPAKTPEEQIERVFGVLRNDLADQLLAEIKARPPSFFEKVVVDLLLAMGYGGTWHGARRVLGRSGDGSIDGTIMEDKLGLDIVYVQAKRWENTVGRPVIQAFAGSLEGVRARKGVMITTSTFTEDARIYVKQIEKKIVLIDGQQLADLMIEHGVGVVVRQSYVLKRVDIDYFESR
jgi:restriction system protein